MQLDLSKFTITIKEQTFFDWGNEAILRAVKQAEKDKTLPTKVQYLVNRAAPALAYGANNSLVRRVPQ